MAGDRNRCGCSRRISSRASLTETVEPPQPLRHNVHWHPVPQQDRRVAVPEAVDGDPWLIKPNLRPQEGLGHVGAQLDTVRLRCGSPTVTPCTPRQLPIDAVRAGKPARYAV